MLLARVVVQGDSSLPWFKKASINLVLSPHGMAKGNPPKGGGPGCPPPVVSCQSARRARE